MKKLLTLALAIVTSLSMLSCASAPKYHMFEGPPRLTISAPRTLRTGQKFLLKARLLGDQNLLPFDDYLIVVVKAKDSLMATRSFILTQRNITGTMVLTPDFYNMYKGYSRGMDSPMDHVDPLPVMEPIEGYDELDLNLKVRIKMEIWIAEINYKNVVVPVKMLVHQKFDTDLSCVHQTCMVGMY